jgi:hypothetical protein
MSSENVSLSRRGMQRLRLAVIFTAIAVLLATTLLIKETAIIFSTFMFLGPALLFAAIVLLAWTILEELRTKRVL